jgi:hypothetical protein
VEIAFGALVAGGVEVALLYDFYVVDQLVSPLPAGFPHLAPHKQYAVLVDLFQQTYHALDPIIAKLAEQEARKSDQWDPP